MENLKTSFQRAVFLGWYCKYGDCSFCYMSTKANKQEKNPKKCRRRFSSIFAEVLICKKLGWDIEFISGGYESFSKEELLFIIKTISGIMNEKLWLNIGYLSEEEIEMFKPYMKGYAGTVETVNWELRKKICPSKKLKPIVDTFERCDKSNLKKTTTIIIGLGETIEDFKNLKDFIEKYNVDKITFYALNPHEGTPFEKSPSLEYYKKWIQKTRENFPDLEIVAGAWIDKIDYYVPLIKSGADSFTKLPSIRKFNSKEFQKLESYFKKNNIEMKGTLTKIPCDVDWNKEVDNLDIDKEMKQKVKKKLRQYLSKMS